MDLHEALIKIISHDGQEAIIDPNIINTLNSLHVYKDTPAIKHVLSTVINEGYTKRLLSIGTWNIDCQKLILQFVRTTGFQYEISKVVFLSIAYAMGWTKNVDFDALKEQLKLDNLILPSSNIEMKFKGIKIDDTVEHFLMTLRDYGIKYPTKRGSKEPKYKALYPHVDFEGTIIDYHFRGSVSFTFKSHFIYEMQIVLGGETYSLKCFDLIRDIIKALTSHYGPYTKESYFSEEFIYHFQAKDGRIDVYTGPKSLCLNYYLNQNKQLEIHERQEIWQKEV